jgi:uncharacterized membrane protein HdeD (DUF308 family)
MSAALLAASRDGSTLVAARRRILAAGLGLLVLGFAAPILPDHTTLLLGATAGWLLWMAGALMLGFSLLLLSRNLKVAGIVAALVALVCGVYLTFHPTTGAFATALLLAGALIMDGSFQLVLALRLRPFHAWRWMVGSALASLIAAAFLAAGFPARSPEAIATMLAVAFVSSGLALVVLGLTQSRATPRRPAGPVPRP